MNNSTSQLALPALSQALSKTLVVTNDGGDLSIDPGLLLIGELDRRIGLCDAMAGALTDVRQAAKVRHSFAEMVRVRVGALCMGYSDCNDLDSKRHDPAFLVFCEQQPVGEQQSVGEQMASGQARQPRGLASQPTLSRFENHPGPRELYRMAVVVARQCIAQLPLGTRTVIIEVDSSENPCHGNQQLRFFNGFYDCHCYLPLFVHVVDEAGRRYQVATLLRPGNAAGTKGFKAVISRAITLVRERLPDAAIMVRCDSGFGEEDLLSYLEKGKFLQKLDKLQVRYVIGLPQNKKLHELSAFIERDACLRYSQTKVHWLQLHRRMTKDQWRQRLKKRRDIDALPGGADRMSDWTFGQDSLEPWPDEWDCTEYGSVYYQAGTWQEPRRVVVSSSVVMNPRTFLPELNTRYVVTNLLPQKNGSQQRAWSARDVYSFYCERGDQENRIKEFKRDLSGTRTSCHRFFANQFRLLLHAAAKLLMNILQAKLPPSVHFKNPQIDTLRDRLLKVAARVTVSHRRIVVHLASSFRYFDIWKQLSAAIARET